MTTERQIPPDFPRDPHPASISGAHPKFAARMVGDKYAVGLTPDELWDRYDTCEDLAQQLAAYCRRKELEKPNWSRTQIVERTCNGVRSKGWDISEPELAWVMARLAVLLG